jgi:hypothetical protein
MVIFLFFHINFLKFVVNPLLGKSVQLSIKDLMKKVTAAQKLDCSYSLGIIGKHSGEVSPIGWKMKLIRNQWAGALHRVISVLN